MFGKKKKEIKQEASVPNVPMPNPMKEMMQEQEEKQQQEQVYEPQMQKSPQETEEAQRWVVGEIATQTERVLHDKSTGKSYDIYSAIALILNKAYEE